MSPAKREVLRLRVVTALETGKAAMVDYIPEELLLGSPFLDPLSPPAQR